MALLERMQEEVKAAMRSGDALTKETLRMAVAALKNRRIEAGQDLDEAEELAVITKEVKKREDSAEQYDAAHRPELAERERAELKVLRAYLPAMLSEEATRELVEKVCKEHGLTSKKQLGQVMKNVLATHKGRVDGKLVQRLASEILE